MARAPSEEAAPIANSTPAGEDYLALSDRLPSIRTCLRSAKTFVCASIESTTPVMSLKNSQHRTANFLSEIVPYWTALYPELADHQKVSSSTQTDSSAKMRSLIKGEAERLEGKIQEKAGKAFRKIDEAVEKVNKAISRKR